MQNIPEIAKKLLIASCEYHEESDIKELFVPVESLIKQYEANNNKPSEKVYLLAFNYLVDKKYIRIKKKNPFTGIPDFFEITALGFDEATRNS